MPARDGTRRDALAGLPALGAEREPATDTDVIAAALARRARARPPRPSERARTPRRLSVTFRDAEIPERLRALALAWEMLAPDGKSPNVSAVIEALLLPALEAAELNLSESEGK